MLRRMAQSIETIKVRTRETLEVLLQTRDIVGDNKRLLKRIKSLLEVTMSEQIDLLRQAISDNAEASSEALARVEAKIAELGEPDPDLSNDIATLRATTDQIKSIANPATPNPGDEDYVPGPVEGGSGTETGGDVEAPAEEAPADGETLS